MFRNISAVHVIIVLVVVLLLFGANRLPGLARSVGQSMKIFKNEVKDLADDGKGTTPAGTTTTVTDPVVGTAPDPVATTAPERPADTPPDATTPPRA